MTRVRLRELGITIGQLPTGEYNAITDVPGVLVGHSTVIADEPHVVRTGVTVVVPNNGHIWENFAFAGSFSFNGFGEMTGLPWVEESGLLTSVIGISNTYAIGTVHHALVAYPLQKGYLKNLALPIAAETYDGHLSDINSFPVTQAHVYEALDRAKAGVVEEGNVGGGTGMICHDFKGGIGTSSRLVTVSDRSYTVGVLVQSNYGGRKLLRVNGVPVGLEIDERKVPLPRRIMPQAGSIIIIIATDAPLLPVQCKRLARRATLGLARVGGNGHNGSGDLFLAFATGNTLPVGQNTPYTVNMLPHNLMNLLFDAVADATEEAILNALTAAETMQGYQGNTAFALPLDELQHVMAKYGRST